MSASYNVPDPWKMDCNMCVICVNTAHVSIFHVISGIVGEVLQSLYGYRLVITLKNKQTNKTKYYIKCALAL